MGAAEVFDTERGEGGVVRDGGGEIGDDGGGGFHAVTHPFFMERAICFS